MHLKKIVQKKQNLTQIQTRVSFQKNILLVSMMKLSSQFNFHLKQVVNNQQLLLSLHDYYHVNNPFIHANKLLKTPKWEKLKRFVAKLTKPQVLWIYLKEEQKYNTDSYSRYEKVILAAAKKDNLLLITIGKESKKFAEANSLNVLFHFKIDTTNLADQVGQIVHYYYQQNQTPVYFVINSNKNANQAFQILPVDEFNLAQLLHYQVEPLPFSLKKLKIYPNIEEFMSSQIRIYLTNVIQTLVIESSFYAAKNQLVKNNQILKDLDEQIAKIKKQLTQIKRELEIEEIVMLTKNNQKFGLQQGGQRVRD